MWLGNNDEAEKYFNISFDLGLDTAQNLQAYVVLLLRTGRFEQARSVGQDIQKALGLNASWWDRFIDGVANESSRAAAVRVVEDAIEADQVVPIMQLGIWALLDEQDRALDLAEQIFQLRSFYVGGFLFSQELARTRQNPRFGAVLETSPIPRFWREHGWPDVCRQDTEGALACD